MRSQLIRLAERGAPGGRALPKKRPDLSHMLLVRTVMEAILTFILIPFRVLLAVGHESLPRILGNNAWVGANSGEIPMTHAAT